MDGETGGWQLGKGLGFKPLGPEFESPLGQSPGRSTVGRDKLPGYSLWLGTNNRTPWEVILQKQDICLSDVEDESMAGLNDFPSLKECKCFLGGVDFVTLIFMLLALPLHRMPTAIAACFAVLKPGGLLLFRDYGNFPTKNIKPKNGFKEYMQSDGTRSYFFLFA
ncbi:hypothetical protein ACSBR1_007190 [Camellia fascicularis]